MKIHDHVGKGTFFQRNWIFKRSKNRSYPRAAPTFWEENPWWNAWWNPQHWMSNSPWKLSVSFTTVPNEPISNAAGRGAFRRKKILETNELYPYLNTFRLALGSTNMAMEEMDRLNMYFPLNMWVPLVMLVNQGSYIDPENDSCIQVHLPYVVCLRYSFPE